NSSGTYQIDLMKSGGGFLFNLSSSTSNDTEPSYSPDGNTIAFESDRSGNHDIYTMSATDGSGVTDLTNNAAADERPVYAPDGQRIAFDSDRSGNGDIYTMDVTGNNQVDVTNNAASDLRPAWQPVLGGTKVAGISDAGFNPTILSIKDGDRMEWDASGASD